MLRFLAHDGLLIRDPEQPWLDLESRDALDTLGLPRSSTGLRSGHMQDEWR